MQNTRLILEKLNEERFKRKRVNRRKFIIGGACLAGAYGGLKFWPAPEHNNMDIKFGVLQSMRDVILTNNLDPEYFLRERGTNEELPSYRGDFFFERKHNGKDNMEYSIQILNNQPLILPKARYVSISFDAGYCNYFLIYLPYDNLDLPTAKALASECAARFTAAGYKKTSRDYGNDDDLTEADFAQSALHAITVSKWQCPIQGVREMTYFELGLEITSSQGNVGSTMPPLAALFTSFKPRKPVYMLRITGNVSGELFDELSALSTARSGAPNTYLPLRDYYNDPDWRPENWNGKYI